MKGRICALLALFLLLPGCGGGASEPMRVQAGGAALIDMASGRLLFGQDEDRMLPMASTTKVMTALLALEACALDEVVVASERASGVPGTSIYLGMGEELTMEQMLYGLLLRSGNDAAVAIAEHVAGDAETFAGMMNVRAVRLGVDAHFENPHGLDADGHAASALALARIYREAMRSEDFRRITGTAEAVIPWAGNDFQRVLTNKNRLLSTYSGATGGKTGYTSRAGRCLVFSAQRDGLELAGAVLSCPDWFGEAGRLLDYGFANYRLEAPLAEGQTACRTAVWDGMEQTVEAVAAQGLSAAVGAGESWRVEYDFGAGVHAPVAQGEVIGTARLYIEDEEVAQAPLVAARAVERRTLLRALLHALGFWSPWDGA